MYNTNMPTRADLPSAKQLWRSTFIAAATAAVLLVTAILPAEYGIDPTGAGRLLGLTQMGEVKTALAAEALTAQEAPDLAQTAPPVTAQPPAAALQPAPAPAQPAALEHRMEFTLKPGAAAEIKLEMREGRQATYRWASRGGTINFDTHGDPYDAPRNFYHGYGKGRSVEGDEGVLRAAFDGHHGWFWRNRSGGDVTVTLETRGEYVALKRVL